MKKIITVHISNMIVQIVLNEKVVKQLAKTKT